MQPFTYSPNCEFKLKVNSSIAVYKSASRKGSPFITTILPFQATIEDIIGMGQWMEFVCVFRVKKLKTI